MWGHLGGEQHLGHRYPSARLAHRIFPIRVDTGAPTLEPEPQQQQQQQQVCWRMARTSPEICSKERQQEGSQGFQQSTTGTVSHQPNGKFTGESQKVVSQTKAQEMNVKENAARTQRVCKDITGCFSHCQALQGITTCAYLCRLQSSIFFGCSAPLGALSRTDAWDSGT